MCKKDPAAGWAQSAPAGKAGYIGVMAHPVLADGDYPGPAAPEYTSDGECPGELGAIRKAAAEWRARAVGPSEARMPTRKARLSMAQASTRRLATRR